MFDDLFQAFLNFRELARILDIVGDIRDHQLAVLHFNDDLSAFRHTDAQAAKFGALSAAIVAYTGFSDLPSGIGLKA